MTGAHNPPGAEPGVLPNCYGCHSQPCECGILFPGLRLGPIVEGWTRVRFMGRKVVKVGTVVVHIASRLQQEVLF